MARPSNPRPIQPVRTGELLIALGVIALMALLISTGYLLGRMQQRRSARRHIKSRQLKTRIDSRQLQHQRRNLRLVTRKRR